MSAILVLTICQAAGASVPGFKCVRLVTVLISRVVSSRIMRKVPQGIVETVKLAVDDDKNSKCMRRRKEILMLLQPDYVYVLRRRSQRSSLQKWST